MKNGSSPLLGLLLGVLQIKDNLLGEKTDF